MKLPRPGDRIRLISMPDDPDPITAGATGTVQFVHEHTVGGERWAQIDVDWDNGRQLMLSAPHDRFEILG